jgi:hypothetical protein
LTGDANCVGSPVADGFFIELLAVVLAFSKPRRRDRRILLYDYVLY